MNLQVPVDNPGGRAILSLDAAKALDSVEWPYLLEILERFGVGNRFIAWVKVLYSKPRARLRINNNLSSPLELYRGTRQGCPLSPLLFALAVEPLAILIRNSPEVVGFRRGQREEKISLYADDALIYLGDTAASSRTVMEIIGDFGSFSGFTINWSKSTLMPIDQLKEQLPEGAEQIVIVNSFKYLGVMVSPDPAEYLQLNLGPLLVRQKVKCNSWCKLPLSVIGRANLIKMVWAPQQLYIFHNAPMWISNKWFKQIDTLMRELIWKKKVARISLATLQYGKDRGGLAVPHSKMYFLASQLQQMAGWGREGNEDPICNLMTISDPALKAASHMEMDLPSMNGSEPTSILLKRVWGEIQKALKITGVLPFTPIWHNKRYPEVQELQGFTPWKERGIWFFAQLYEGEVLKTYEQLCREFQLNPRSFYQYLQLRHALQAQQTTHPLTVSTSSLLREVLVADTRKGLTSKIYRELLSSVQDHASLKCRNKWVEDIGGIDENQWEMALESIPAVSVSASHRLSQLFILHRAYRTPEQLYKWGGRDSPL